MPLSVLLKRATLVLLPYSQEAHILLGLVAFHTLTLYMHSTAYVFGSGGHVALQQTLLFPCMLEFYMLVRHEVSIFQLDSN